MSDGFVERFPQGRQLMIKHLRMFVCAVNGGTDF